MPEVEDQEAFVDEEVSPLIREAFEKCLERGIPFYLHIEFAPSRHVRTANFEVEGMSRASRELMLLVDRQLAAEVLTSEGFPGEGSFHVASEG